MRKVTQILLEGGNFKAGNFGIFCNLKILVVYFKNKYY